MDVQRGLSRGRQKLWELHGRADRTFQRAKALYHVAINLLVHAHHHPESTIAYALDGILPPGMRKHAGNDAALVDWAVVGDDVASSIAAVSLPDDDTPDETAFPLRAVGTER